MERVLRDVQDEDIPIFFEHQNDPEAIEMAAFPAREWEPFREHWGRIRLDESCVTKAIVSDGEVVGNVLTEDPEQLYFRVTSQKHREWIRDTQCPTCLSPCQMNVAAVKQVVPYIKFLVRASREKRRGAAANIAAAAGSVSD